MAQRRVGARRARRPSHDRPVDREIEALQHIAPRSPLAQARLVRLDRVFERGRRALLERVRRRQRGRKTRDVWRLWVNYGQGWEVEVEENTRAEIMERLREYHGECGERERSDLPLPRPARTREGGALVARIYSRRPPAPGTFERGDVVVTRLPGTNGRRVKAIITGDAIPGGYPAIALTGINEWNDWESSYTTAILVDPLRARRVGRVQRIPKIHYGRIKRPRLPRARTRELTEEQGRLAYHLKRHRGDPEARRLLEHKAVRLDARLAQLPPEVAPREVVLGNFAAVLGRAHRDLEAAHELDAWIAGKGGVAVGARRKRTGSRATPLSRLLLDALRESGEDGLRRRDLTLIAYRSRYPCCAIDDAARHTGQCSVLIGQLLRQWAHKGTDRRWRLRDDVEVGPPYTRSHRRTR